jgi:tetratricopeptide (TPR) repeat protein
MRGFRLLVLFLLSLPALVAVAATSEVAQILDQPDVIVAGDEAEIRINFTTPITYLRSFPEGPSDTLRVALSIQDPCVAEQLVIQESKNSPRTNTVTPFTLTFPEIITKPQAGNQKSQAGNATCQVTKNRVDTNKTMKIKFANVNTYKVRLGDDNHSIILRVPLLAKPEAVFVEPKFTVEAPSEGASAKELMTSAKAAMAAGEYENATQMFNRLLNLPPNEYSQEAQELVGNSREKNGDFTKAKIEYDLYLKLYPGTEGALRVNTRLAAIKDGTAKVADNKFSTKKQINQVNQTNVYGSLSQYYYGGRTLTETKTPGTKTNDRTTDQSALVTSFDITGHWRHNQYDDKIVFRDAQTHNFPPGDNFRDINRLNAAYWDHEDKSLGYMFRLGRQPGNSQGVLGRFDGGFARYNINDNFRITGVAGVPDDGSHSKIITDRQFYGSAIEFGTPASNVSGNVYAIQQNADGFTERRAVGSELRYFNNTTSWFGLLDYDTIYDRVNIALLQGNWTGPYDITFNALLDHRKSPTLYGESAIPAVTGVRAVGGLRHVLTKKQIIKTVNDVTADSDTALFGLTKQVTPKWQLGGDIRMNRTSGTRGIDFTGIVPNGALIASTRSSGTAYTYSMQAIGNNTIFADDTSVIYGSYVDDPAYYAHVLGLTNVATFRTKWHVTSSLNFYNQRSDSSLLDLKIFKVAPILRVSYQVTDAGLLEAELGFEKSYSDDNTNTKINSTRESMFVGYRWDF